jgi:YggT family protein
MPFLGQILIVLLNIYEWIVIVAAVVSWLIAFDVIRHSNPQTQNLEALLKRLTDPVFKPISKYVPPLGGIDVTPIIVIILIEVLKVIVERLFFVGPYNYF